MCTHIYSVYMCVCVYLCECRGVEPLISYPYVCKQTITLAPVSNPNQIKSIEFQNRTAVKVDGEMVEKKEVTKVVGAR